MNNNHKERQQQERCRQGHFAIFLACSMKDDGADHHHTQPDRRYDGEPGNHSGERRQNQPVCPTISAISIQRNRVTGMAVTQAMYPLSFSRRVKALVHPVSRNARASRLRTIHNAIPTCFHSFFLQPLKAMEVERVCSKTQHIRQHTIYFLYAHTNNRSSTHMFVSLQHYLPLARGRKLSLSCLHRYTRQRLAAD